jgi:hypothetical protein
MHSYIFKIKDVLNLVRRPEVDKYLLKTQNNKVLIITEKEDQNEQSSLMADVEKATKVLNIKK